MIPNLTMIVEIVEFIVFIVLCRMFIWPPLVRAIEDRRKTIADGLAEAERGKSSLADAQKERESILRQARERAQEIVTAAERAATQRIEESKSQARIEGERLNS